MESARKVLGRILPSGVNRTDFATGVLLTLVGAAILILLPWQIGGETLAAVTDMRSPAFFPILAGVLLLVLSLILIVRSVSEQRGEGGFAVESPGRVVGAVIVLVLATALTYIIGLLPTATITVLALAAVFGYRRYAIIIPIAVLCPVALYYLFERTLLVLLPRGFF